MKGERDSELPFPKPAAIRALMAALFACVALFAGLNLSPLMDYHTPRWLFDLNREGNVPAWFSSTLLLLLALSSAASAWLARVRAGSPSEVRAWTAVGVLFVGLSLDETASLHETLGIQFAKHVGEFEGVRGPYMWVVVLAPIGLLVAVLMASWFRRIWRPGHRSRALAFTALVVWLSVPGLEVVEPLVPGQTLSVILEESLELCGEILLLGAFLTHLDSERGRRTLEWVDPRAGRGTKAA